MRYFVQLKDVPNSVIIGLSARMISLHHTDFIKIGNTVEKLNSNNAEDVFAVIKKLLEIDSEESSKSEILKSQNKLIDACETYIRSNGDEDGLVARITQIKERRNRMIDYNRLAFNLQNEFYQQIKCFMDYFEKDKDITIARGRDSIFFIITKKSVTKLYHNGEEVAIYDLRQTPKLDEKIEKLKAQLDLKNDFDPSFIITNE